MAKQEIIDVTEQKRLNEAREAGIPWKKWGPYLSERQWGTVREDYSEDGNAWDYFSHDQSRSRAYRWGEDGLAGICDDKQRLCFALALWNERDPILKERAVRAHQQRGEPRGGREGVLLLHRQHSDALLHEVSVQVPAAGVSLPGPDRDKPGDGRARSSSTNCLIRVCLTRTGILTCSWSTPRKARKTYSSASPFTIAGRKRPGCGCCRRSWFRNTWSWGEDDRRPSLREAAPGTIQASHHELGEYWLHCDGRPELLFTENESNARPSLGPAEYFSLRQGCVPRRTSSRDRATR